MRSLGEFARAGHLPTLLGAFLYFDVSFMVWVLFGPLAPYVSEELGLSPVQKGLLTAVPLLGGSLFRLVLGPLGDRYGGRRVAAAGMLLTLVPLLLGWTWARTFPALLAVGLLLGIAGASFAVALPLVSRWYPPEHQGLAMGIAGAGNSGTLLASLFAPRLAEALGWQAVLGLAAVPVAAILAVFLVLAKDSPNRPAPRRAAEYGRVLREPDTLWFCLIYSLTFGGFVGLASFLSLFFRDQFGLSRVQSGDLTTLCVMAGSLLRPVGGYLSDRLGGVRMLRVLIALAAALFLGLAQVRTVPGAILCFLSLTALLGMGNGSVFQLVPQRFPREVGVVTGLVGAAGGIGGFMLPSLMGLVRQSTDSFSPGFLALSGYAAACLALLALKEAAWSAPPGRTRPTEIAATPGGAE